MKMSLLYAALLRKAFNGRARYKVSALIAAVSFLWSVAE